MVNQDLVQVGGSHHQRMWLGEVCIFTLKRSLIVPILASHDVADTDSTCPVRFATTQPTQALGMLNSEFMNKQAEVFAEFLKREFKDDPETQVKTALLRATQRDPAPTEIEQGLKFLNDMQEEFQLSKDDALKYYCLLCLNLNEFMYLD